MILEISQRVKLGITIRLFLCQKELNKLPPESGQPQILDQEDVFQDDPVESPKEEDIEPEFVSADNELFSLNSSLEFIEVQSRDIKRKR